MYIGDAFAEKPIYIVNHLDVPLEFKEIENRQNIKIKSPPPGKVDPGSTKSFSVTTGDSFKNEHLNIKYYVNNSSSVDEVGIIFKYNIGSNPHCPKDHPDSISEEVKHCGSWTNDNEWQYIFSPK